MKQGKQNLELSPWQEGVFESLQIEDQSVHVWRVPMHVKPNEIHLSEDEHERANALRCPKKRETFVTARTRLRQILGRYLTLSPESLQFQYNHNGKPYLKGNPLSFNLSHSGQWCLCAVALNCKLGVDLESNHPGLNFESVAQRFFSPNELQWLQRITQPRQRRNFIRLWTRKEAWLKAKGGGFSEQDLDLASAHLDGLRTFADGWWLMNFAVARDYLGALAVFGNLKQVVRLHWKE